MPGLLFSFSAVTRRLLKEYRYLVLLMLLFVCGLVAIYAKWWAWYGGLAWGPRFFVFAAVPASILLAVRLRHATELGPTANALTLLVLVLSGWVGVSGAVADLSTLDFCVRNDAATGGSLLVHAGVQPALASPRHIPGAHMAHGDRRPLLRARLRLAGRSSRLGARAGGARPRGRELGDRMAIVNNVSAVPPLQLIPKAEFDRVREREPDLALIADMCRANALTAVKRAGSGHLGSSFSALDLVVHLLFEELNTAELGWEDPDRDVFFSSKGHDVPGLYAALHALGVIPTGAAATPAAARRPRRAP